MEKKALLGMRIEEIRQSLLEYDLPRFAYREIALWIYQRGASEIEDFTNISSSARTRIAENFEVGLQSPVKVSQSNDGTKKYLFRTAENRFIETAYIPENKRHTLCISSQVGCKLGCLFCMTARQGFQGQLSVRQILNQILGIPESRDITNIVFMGMGEPFDNTDQVMGSLEILTADYGLNFNPKKITVSTVGLIPGMVRFIEESKCHLAVSLHTPFDNERAMLMPVETIYPVQEVIKTLKSFSWEGQRRVSFEYILFKGLNDSTAHINQLARLLNGLNCRINLMRFHPIPDSPLKGSTDQDLIRFRDSLNRKGITATIRASRGEDILAACGLLSTREVNKKA